MKSTYFLILTGILIATAVQAQVINLNDDNVSVTKLRSTQNSVPHEFLKEAKAIRFFAINPVLQRANSVKVGNTVQLQLFEDKNYATQVTDIITDINGTVALTLKLPDYPMGFAIITTSTEGKSLVNISIPELGQTFGSRYDAIANQQYLIEVDESQRTPFACENDVLEIPKRIEIFDDNDHFDDATEHNHTHLRSVQANCGPEAFTNPSAPATISLLIVYTPAAASSSYTSSHSGINNVIATMIALGNLCMANSLTGITLTLARSEQVSYTGTDLSPALNALQNPSDGSMDNVHALRKQYNADLVQLLCAGNTGGLGYLLSSTGGRYDYGFSAAGIESCGDNYPCSVHEIGHNMGLGHGAQHITNISNGIFSYSQGWRWEGTSSVNMGGVSTTFKGSVMTYWSGDNYTDGKPCYNVPYFSNPSISYEGKPTGNATQADAARSLRELKHVIAFYSDIAASVPAAPTNVQYSNPTNNGATITWNAVSGATSYRLYFYANGSWLYYSLLTDNSYTLNDSYYFQPCNSYQVYIKAVNDCGEGAASSTLTFRTFCSTTDPVVVTAVATNITTTTAKLNKTVTPASDAVTSQGFRYKASSSSTWLTSTDGNLTGLTETTQYQFYAYATTAATTFTGNTLTFTTGSSYTWTPQSSSTVWNNSNNWVPTGVLSATSRAIIPRSASYPVLTAPTTVGEILFKPGAELGRQDRLTYEKAFVQLDFSADDFRNRWWMLTNPLQELFVGDLSFGGLPGMDIKKYITNESSGQGAWTSLSAGYGHLFRAGDDFQIWLASDPNHPDKTKKGLMHSHANGVITLPHFETSEAANVHWTHDYNSTNYKSAFYGWAINGSNEYARNGSPVTVTRDINKAYKLVTGNVFTKELDFGLGVNRIVYYAATGNPFMSSIDFEKLQQENESLIGENYWIWVGPGVANGGSYAIYNISTGPLGRLDNPPLSNIIAPMQSFIVERQSNSTGTDITFNIETISATGQSGNAKLRAATQSNDLLEIIASTPQSAFRAAIASHENGSPVFNSKDSRRFSAGINALPDIYMLKPAADNSMVAVTANVLNEIKEEIVVPLAIATTYEGPVTLSFAGMDRYNARIFFVDADAQNKKENELTGKARYEYTFNYVPEKIKGTVAASENRFFIRLSPTNQTGIDIVTPNNILIYNRTENTIQVVSGELIQHISVVNLQGQNIYSNASVNAYEHSITGLAPGVYVVKAASKQEVKTIKIIVK